MQEMDASNIISKCNGLYMDVYTGIKSKMA